MKRELLWIFTCANFILFLCFWLFGLQAFTSEEMIDVNIHDTYYLISQRDFSLIAFSFGLITLYGLSLFIRRIGIPLKKS